MALLGFKIQSMIKVDDLVMVFNELKVQNAGVFDLSTEGLSIESVLEELRAEMLSDLSWFNNTSFFSIFRVFFSSSSLLADPFFHHLSTKTKKRRVKQIR